MESENLAVQGLGTQLIRLMYSQMKHFDMDSSQMTLYLVGGIVQWPPDKLRVYLLILSIRIQNACWIKFKL